MEVVPKPIQAGTCAIIADCPVYLLDAATFCQSGAACLSGRCSCGDSLLGLQIDIGLNFFRRAGFPLVVCERDFSLCS